MRTLFLSDVHLGSRHAKTKYLLDYLSNIKKKHYPERVYLIGDFIDGWRIKGWNDDCNLIIRKLLSFVRRGVQIHYVAGNHDEFLRKFIHDHPLLELGSIHISNEAIHETVDGRRLLITHGDMFDLASRHRWLCRVGDVGYSFLIHLNTLTNFFRRKLGFRNYWSLSKAIKHKVKQACQYISAFEEHLTHYAKNKGCDGVVCGHIHTADLREEDGFLYCNTGDWVESCTSIVEDKHGKMRLEHYITEAQEPPEEKMEIAA
jgi:UDP-2,3-diacylglucosamine pyrophosphatase LpxH